MIHAYFHILILWAGFGEKWVCSPHRLLRVWGFITQPNNFGHNCYLDRSRKLQNFQASHAGLKGLESLNPTKKLAHWVELLSRPLSQKNVFENLGPEPPPPLNNISITHVEITDLRRCILHTTTLIHYI